MLNTQELTSSPEIPETDSDTPSNQFEHPASPPPETDDPPPYYPPASVAGDRDGSFKLYLTEIGKVKLLTPSEEIELADRIKKGDSEAREQMIKANLRLVVKIAREYENIGLPLMDLISEGNIGLMKAVERFDASFGTRLSTYASWWIKQSIKRALANQAKIIRLPVHLVGKISHMNRVDRELQEALGRDPTDEELGDELGINASRVTHMRVAALRPSSLDAPIGDEDSNTLGDVVQDEKAETPYDRLEGAASVHLLRELVKNLKPREAEILTARYGLSGAPQKTLDEIGMEFNISHERARQVQITALRKLRQMLEKMDRPTQ
jgi:RNA polymerase primary sigma factor